MKEIDLKEELRKKSARFRKLYPWVNSFYNAKYRCLYPNKNYSDRGIKILMNKEDFKELWFRDKAYLMKKPTVDRIDNDGNYIKNNCRFIEHAENIRRSRLGIPRSEETKRKISVSYRKLKIRRTHCKYGHPYDKENTYITPIGYRDCIKCRKEARKRWKMRLKRY